MNGALLPVVTLVGMLLPLFASPLAAGMGSSLYGLISGVSGSSNVGKELSRILPFLGRAAFSAVSLGRIVLRCDFSFIPVLIGGLGFVWFVCV